MNSLRKFLCMLAIAPFFLGSNTNAMNDDQKEDPSVNKKPSGLHRPTKKSPEGFIEVEPLKEAHVDEDGRIYYNKSQPLLTSKILSEVATKQ